MSFHYQRGEEILKGFRVLSAICERESYSIYRVEDERYSLCITESQLRHWRAAGSVPDALAAQFAPILGGFCYITDKGYKVYTPQHGPYPEDWESVDGFCYALNGFARGWQKEQYPNVVYIEKYDCLLPLDSSDDEKESKSRMVGQYLTKGLPIDAEDKEKMKLFCSWLSAEEIELVRSTCGVSDEKEKETTEEAEAAIADVAESDFRERTFSLPGREKLATFFENQVVDFFRNPADYQRMGIHTVPAILLYGPPGSGKTYAVEKLSEFLGFPCFEINADSVASPYIHDTSKKIAEIFQKAMEKAPSVLVIDELESYLGSRESRSEHRVEEVDEFLRSIPKAIEKQVLIIGMTNHLSMIDKAVLRKGRFDQIIELGMPSPEEIENVLVNVLAELPKEANLPLATYAERLQGHPLSDVAFLVREAGRRSVRRKKDKIDSEVLSEVLAELCGKTEKQETRRIGF